MKAIPTTRVHMRASKICKELELTYADMAEGLGIPYSTLSAYLSGYRNPSEPRKKMIAEFLECEVRDLWKIKV